jgi:pimeloyl-ACP methyl ester carboxylesterase
MLISLGNHRISYESTGEGTPLLLMHAFPLSQSMFEPQREALAETARLLTFDAPGVGESAPAVVSIDDLADLAAALLDAEKIDRAVVGGVSMGGYATLAFARRHADRLRGLLLASTRVIADPAEAKQGRRDMAALALEKGPAEIAARMLPKLLGETTHRERPAVVDRVRAIAESVPGKTIARLLDALASRADSTALLPQILVPTLVLTGEQDPIAPPQEASEWAARIPNARFVALPNAGHLPNLETPEAFNAAVEDFLEALPN